MRNNKSKIEQFLVRIFSLESFLMNVQIRDRGGNDSEVMTVARNTHRPGVLVKRLLV